MTIRTNIIATCVAVSSIAGAAFGQWNRVLNTVSPSEREQPVMGYDTARGNTVMFGGAVASLGYPSNETWVYDGQWTKLSPKTVPWGRYDCDMVFDVVRKVGVMYGGSQGAFSGPLLDETWEWDGTNWNRKYPANNPGGRKGYAAAFDLFRQRVVIYGGSLSNGLPNAVGDTWEYDGTDWTKVATANSPGPRIGACMAYSWTLQKVVLFGGIEPQGGTGGDETWTYDGTNWTKLQTMNKPAARYGGRVVYDHARDRVLLYGGWEAPPLVGAYDDTWEFDGTDWRYVQNATPSPRSGFGMVMDYDRLRPVLFGGASVPSTGAQLNEVWEYGAAYQSFAAGCQGSAGIPTVSSTGYPRLGGTQSIQLGNLTQGASTALLMFGVSNTAGSTGPLPLDLSFAGLTGCNLYVSTEMTIPLAAAGGVAGLTWVVPYDPTLFGARFYNQGISIDPGQNAAGLVMTNGIAAQVGY